MVSKSNPLANKEEIMFEELSQMSCVRVPHAAEVNAVVDSLYQQYNMVPNIAFEAGNISASLVYIMESNCFTVAPILAGVDFSQISILKVKGHSLSRPIYFAWNEHHKFSIAERDFYNFAISRTDYLETS